MGFLVILLGLPATTSGVGSEAFISSSASAAGSATGSVSGVVDTGVTSVSGPRAGGKSKGASGSSVGFSLFRCQRAPLMFGRFWPLG